VLRRQTGRHHAARPTPRTQFRAKDGAYVCALIAGRLTPKFIGELADLLDTNGIAANTSHIIDDLVAGFIASLPAEEVYHEAAIYNGSPWRISRRAPLIGEHNTEIFCDELGLSRAELSVLAENRVI
jgi:crotonobetainyl-CoA:carnitine CoA-transferase CaiB-like acyl-CoA transferase